MHEGRARLDFSEWDRLSPEMSKIRLMDSCRMMTEGKMPVWYYRPMHPMTSTPDPAVGGGVLPMGEGDAGLDRRRHSCSNALILRGRKGTPPLPSHAPNV